MKKLLLRFVNDRTVRANSVMVIGNFVANIGAYFYHLSMGRMLIPSDYGALQSLISVTNLFTVPLVTLNTVVAKFVSTYVGKREPQKITALYRIIQKSCIIVLVIGGILFSFFSQPILSFLHLTSFLDFLFLEFALFFGLLVMLNRSMLQGLSQFVSLTVAQFIESYGKLLLGILAVSLGFRVSGAFGGFVLITLVSYGYMQFKLGKFIGKREKGIKLPLRPLILYAVPSFVMNVSMMSLFNTDVVFVRHFFDAYSSGLYSALSVLGKIIYFGAIPVAVAMFPLVSEAHARGEGHRKIFLISLSSIVAIAGGVTLFYSFAPSFALKILIGSQYLGAATYLSRFSIFLSLCAVINLLMYFFLAVHDVFPVYLIGAAALVQAILIWFFHISLGGVISISVGVTSVLTAMLLLYYVYTSRA